MSACGRWRWVPCPAIGIKSSRCCVECDHGKQYPPEAFYWRCPAKVRFASNSDRVADIPDRLLSAKSRPSAVQQTILFDHLIGDLLEMHGHVEPQRFGSLEVDDKLIL